MKRLLQCLAGGVLIPLSTLAVAMVVGAVVEVRPGDWLATALVYPSAFPLGILGPFFPESDSPDPNAPLIRGLLYLTAILMDVVVYSALTYVVLSWRERRKLKPSALRRVV